MKVQVNSSMPPFYASSHFFNKLSCSCCPIRYSLADSCNLQENKADEHILVRDCLHRLYFQVFWSRAFYWWYWIEEKWLGLGSRWKTILKGASNCYQRETGEYDIEPFGTHRKTWIIILLKGSARKHIKKIKRTILDIWFLELSYLTTYNGFNSSSCKAEFIIWSIQIFWVESKCIIILSYIGHLHNGFHSVSIFCCTHQIMELLPYYNS